MLLQVFQWTWSQPFPLVFLWQSLLISVSFKDGIFFLTWLLFGKSIPGVFCSVSGNCAFTSGTVAGSCPDVEIVYWFCTYGILKPKLVAKLGILSIVHEPVADRSKIVCVLVVLKCCLCSFPLTMFGKRLRFEFILLTWMQKSRGVRMRGSLTNFSSGLSRVFQQLEAGVLLLSVLFSGYACHL